MNHVRLFWMNVCKLYHYVSEFVLDRPVLGYIVGWLFGLLIGCAIIIYVINYD